VSGDEFAVRPPDGITLRTATPDDELGVRRVLDGAMLEVPDDLSELLAREQVLVAVGERVVGALVLVPHETEGEAETTGDATDEQNDTEIDEQYRVGEQHLIEAVAVQRRRRGSGIGAALVRAAAERCAGPLTAEFRPAVRPFYESLGFEIWECGSAGESDRLVGRLE
jgi:GNAT superfamily N-acetyltransferase